MRYFLLGSLWLLLCPNFSRCQSKPVILKGSLGVEGGELFTYKLVLREGDSGRLTGYAQTWLKEENDTKAAITGTIDRQRKTLAFRETEIVSNNNFQSRAILCLLQSTLSYKFGNNGFTLEGPVSSTDLAAASCSKGSVVFSTEDVLRSLFAGPASKDSAKGPEAVAGIKQAAIPNSEGPPKIVKDLQKITKGVEKLFEWTTDSVIVEIWDGGDRNGAIISLGYNGVPVLKRYALTGDKLMLRLKRSGKEEEELTVIAEEGGYTGVAIAHLLLTDGNIQYPVIAYNKTGREAVMRIRPKRRK